jgi:hypothetical protein
MLLASCASESVAPPFVYNQKCPHICWLGINPSITTADETRTLLRSSSQIDQNSYTEDESGIKAEWSTKQNGVLSARVGIVLSNGTVKSINFLFTTDVNIQEFVDLLGEPNEISIKKVEAAEVTYFEYIMYYTVSKALIYASTTDKNGPNTADPIDIVYLNIDPDDPDAPKWLLEHQELRQPWLGFGHLEEYLEKRPLPSQ